MITIFSTAKDFRAWPQQNALGSWRFSSFEVLCFGPQQIRDLGIQTTESGAPLINSLFPAAESLSNHRIMCYVNSDIILMPEFTDVANELKYEFHEFLMVGRRWNWHNPLPLAMCIEGWWHELRIRALDNGSLFNAASDYFCFTKGVFDYDEMPPLAVGRYYWDPYLFWYAMQRGVPVIDCTKAVMAIHQDHPIAHRSWDPEGQRNRELAKEAEESGIDLDDVPYEMTADREIVKRFGGKDA